AGAGRRCSATYGRSADSPGDPGRRKYGCLWKKPQPSGDNRACGVSGNSAPAESEARAQCFSSRDARRKRGLATVDMAMSEFHTRILWWLLVLATTSTLVVVAWIYLRGWHALQ